MVTVLQPQLDCARTHVSDTLTELCNIYSPPDAEPYQGEDPSPTLYPSDWTVVATAMPCRLARASFGAGAEALEAAGIVASHGFLLHLDYNASSSLAISKSSRVRITTMNDRDFEVRGVPDVSGSRLTRVLEVDERT